MLVMPIVERCPTLIYTNISGDPYRSLLYTPGYVWVPYHVAQILMGTVLGTLNVFKFSVITCYPKLLSLKGHLLHK